MGKKTVIITHHAPSSMSIEDRYATDALNVFYFSEMTYDLMDNNPDVWIHGHMHTSFDYLIDPTKQICNTRVICNPRGYSTVSTEAGNKGFDANKYIEV